MKKSFLIICFVLLALTALTQESRKQIIMEKLPLREISNSMASIIFLQNPVFHNNPEVSDQQMMEIMNLFISFGSKDLTDSLANIYNSGLSDEELKQLALLPDSSALKDFFAKMPVFTEKSFYAIYQWYLNNMERLDSLLHEYFPEKHNRAETDFNFTESGLKRGKPYVYRKRAGAESVYTNPGSNYKIYYNNEIWEEINPVTLNPAADIAFKMLDSEVYAILIEEENDLNLKELRYTAEYNFYNASGLYILFNEELRKVNKNELLSLQFKAIVNNTEVVYHNYYYTGNHHVIQFSVFTGSASYDKEKNNMEDLLNGLTIIKQ